MLERTGDSTWNSDLSGEVLCIDKENNQLSFITDYNLVSQIFEIYDMLYQGE